MKSPLNLIPHFVIFSFIFFIAIIFFKFPLLNTFLYSHIPIFEFFASILIFFSFIFAIVYIFNKGKWSVVKYIPLAIVVLSLLIWFFDNKLQITNKYYYSLKIEQFNKLVVDIKEKKVNYIESFDKYSKIKLSDEQSKLSKQIYIGKKKPLSIFSYQYRGIGEISGFLYSENDLPPEDGDFGFQIVNPYRLAENWFWVKFD